MVTTSRPTVTRSIWLETRTQYLHDNVDAVVSHSIPHELIINADQTSSKYVPTADVTMAEKNSKHVTRKGANDKRGITVHAGRIFEWRNTTYATHIQRKDK